MLSIYAVKNNHVSKHLIQKGLLKMRQIKLKTIPEVHYTNTYTDYTNTLIDVL